MTFTQVPQSTMKYRAGFFSFVRSFVPLCAYVFYAIRINNDIERQMPLSVVLRVSTNIEHWWALAIHMEWRGLVSLSYS